MKPIKMWLAQDDDGMCYLHHEKPRYTIDEYTTKNYATGMIGRWFLESNKDKRKVPTIECMVISKDEYLRLKESEMSVGNET